jgi:hypothetical protein
MLIYQECTVLCFTCSPRRGTGYERDLKQTKQNKNKNFINAVTVHTGNNNNGLSGDLPVFLHFVTISHATCRKDSGSSPDEVIGFFRSFYRSFFKYFQVIKIRALLIIYYAMKVYGGVDVQIHVFLTSALVGGEWSASRFGRFTPAERATRYQLDRNRIAKPK